MLKLPECAERTASRPRPCHRPLARFAPARSLARAPTSARSPTELFGAGECACRGQRMNRYHFASIDGHRACARWCTASLGCVGIRAGPKAAVWEKVEEVHDDHDVRVATYDQGCSIYTSHTAAANSGPDMTWTAGVDTACSEIDSLITPAEGFCRTAKRSALLG